jgi:hypothetical protein
VNRNDGLHQQAVCLFQQRLAEGRGFVTSSVVLLEVGNWLSPVPLRPWASRLLERIEQERSADLSAAFELLTSLPPDFFKSGRRQPKLDKRVKL